MKIIVPMAGKGSRFQAEADRVPEYRKPKPLILIKGKPMIQWAMESLPFLDLPMRPAKTKFKVTPQDLIFISLTEQEQKYGITKLLRDTFSNKITVILIPEVTRGAVETALKAKPYISFKEDLIISDSDHYFDGKVHMEAILNKDEDVAGIIPVFKPPDNDPKWSFTLYDNNLTASAVGEKDAVLLARGAYANIGAYYFTKGEIFINEAEKMIAAGEMYGAVDKQEFYVAPLYDRMIKKSLVVKVSIIKKVWGLGTPKDVEYFEKNY